MQENICAFVWKNEYDSAGDGGYLLAHHENAYVSCPKAYNGIFFNFYAKHNKRAPLAPLKGKLNPADLLFNLALKC